MRVHQLIKFLSKCRPNAVVHILSGNIATGEDELNDCDFVQLCAGQIVLASSDQCCNTEANIESEIVASSAQTSKAVVDVEYINVA